MDSRNRPKVIIIGVGFGGLFAARTLVEEPVDILLIDRNNFHLFTPLLYQVATSALDPSEIAYPVRSIFRNNPNVKTMRGEVTEIDFTEKRVEIKAPGLTAQEAYDYLIVAAGSAPSYFGNETFKRYAFELHALSDAVLLRNHILKLFEIAAWTQDPTERDALTTIVVTGGGPTGLETAGAFHELYNHVLDHEYWHRADIKARVILVERLPYVLAPYPDNLRQSALTQLRSLGVEVILENPVEEVAPDHIRLADGTRILTYTLIWAAGVKASSVADMLKVKQHWDGTIPVKSTMEVEGLDCVYAVGDITYLEDREGAQYPKMIPVAQQQGILAAKNILRRIRGQSQEPFRYHDRGFMSTIGRRRAVAWIYKRIPLSGFIAWLAWLVLHLMTLMGFRNRLNVLVNWMWNYFTYDRSVRIILEHPPRDKDSTARPFTSDTKQSRT
jgi:NADH dehydrogenase